LTFFQFILTRIMLGLVFPGSQVVQKQTLGEVETKTLI